MNVLQTSSEAGSTVRTTPSARHLLDQQIWCFGQDIRHPDGNLLLRVGFTQHRNAGTKARVSAYSLRPAANAQLVLWGFGLFYGKEGHGGMFLRRYQFRPVWHPESSLTEIPWDPQQFGNLSLVALPRQKTSIRLMLADIVIWLAGYETWVLETVGLDYRRRCIDCWPKTGLEPDRVPGEWRRLAARWGVH